VPGGLAFTIVVFTKIFGRQEQEDYSLSTIPIFSVKTTNNTYVQDATITWQTEISRIQKLVEASKNLSDYTINVDNEGGARCGSRGRGS